MMETNQKKRIGELFQEYSKYKHFVKPSDLSKGVPPLELQKPFPPDASLIALPKIEEMLPKFLSLRRGNGIGLLRHCRI